MKSDRFLIIPQHIDDSGQVVEQYVRRRDKITAKEMEIVKAKYKELVKAYKELN